MQGEPMDSAYSHMWAIGHVDQTQMQFDPHAVCHSDHHQHIQQPWQGMMVQPSQEPSQMIPLTGTVLPVEWQTGSIQTGIPWAMSTAAQMPVDQQYSHSQSQEVHSYESKRSSTRAVSDHGVAEGGQATEGQTSESKEATDTFIDGDVDTEGAFPLAAFPEVSPTLDLNQELEHNTMGREAALPCVPSETDGVPRQRNTSHQNGTHKRTPSDDFTEVVDMVGQSILSRGIQLFQWCGSCLCTCRKPNTKKMKTDGDSDKPQHYWGDKKKQNGYMLDSGATQTYIATDPASSSRRCTCKRCLKQTKYYAKLTVMILGLVAVIVFLWSVWSLFRYYPPVIPPLCLTYSSEERVTNVHHHVGQLMEEYMETHHLPAPPPCISAMEVGFSRQHMVIRRSILTDNPYDLGYLHLVHFKVLRKEEQLHESLEFRQNETSSHCNVPIQKETLRKCPITVTFHEWPSLMPNTMTFANNMTCICIQHYAEVCRGLWPCPTGGSAPQDPPNG